MSNAGSTLIDGVAAAYSAMGQFYASDWYVAQARNEGYYVYSGCAVTASGTAGKVDLSAGVIFAGTTEVNITAVTAFATTITSIADATNPKWVAVELDPTAPTAAVTFNQGTAAANPQKPTPTSARVVVAWLYVPANATAVDALTSTANGKAKIIEARQLVTPHTARLFATDNAATTLTAGTPSTWATNGTTQTSILASPPTIPANSLSVGDTFKLTASGFYTNNVAASTLEVVFGIIGVSNLIDYITATTTLSTSANARRWGIDATITCIAIGASANLSVEALFFISAPATTTPSVLNFGAAANGDGAVSGNNMTATFASTSARTLDLQFKLGTASGGATMGLRNFSVVKFPA